MRATGEKRRSSLDRKTEGRSRWIAVVVCALAIAAVSGELSRIAVGQEVYVKLTGSNSTGNQTFSGKNGQITLPAGSLPPSPREGMIQNVSGFGLEVYRSGAWQPIGTGSSSSGLFIQHGATGGQTKTKLIFEGANGVVFSGCEARVSPEFGTGPCQYMQGNQQLSGCVSGYITNTQILPCGLHPDGGDLLVGRICTGTRPWFLKPHGAPQTVLQSTVPSVDWVYPPGVGNQVGLGSRQALTMRNTSNTSISIVCPAMTLENIAHNGRVWGFAPGTLEWGLTMPRFFATDSTTPRTANSFAYLYMLGRDVDGVCSPVMSSLSTGPIGSLGSFTWYKRIGTVRWDGSLNLVPFTKKGEHVWYTGTAGNNVLSAGTATTATDVDASAWVPPTATEIRLKWTIYNTAAFLSAALYDYDSGATVAGIEQNGTATYTTDLGVMVEIPASVTGNGKFKYALANVTNRRLDAGVVGYTDSDGQ